MARGDPKRSDCSLRWGPARVRVRVRDGMGIGCWRPPVQQATKAGLAVGDSGVG